jgi:general secretion pathway protein I
MAFAMHTTTTQTMTPSSGTRESTECVLKPLGPRVRGDDGTGFIRGDSAGASRRRGGSATRAVGFSLLEVLVAFVILSLVVTALFRLFSGALGNASAADDYSRAVLVAESVLAEAAAAQPLRETTLQGSTDDGRIEWATRVALYTPPSAGPDVERVPDLMPTRLYRVSVDVTFPAPTGGKRTLALATLRLGTKDAL